MIKSHRLAAEAVMRWGGGGRIINIAPQRLWLALLLLNTEEHALL